MMCGKDVLMPYLLDRKISSIDYIIISHFDTDHSLGCAKIMENIDVLNIILSEQYEENDNYRLIVSLAKKKNIKLIYVEAGNVLNIDDMKITILHPQKELIVDNAMNNNSIVCKIEYKSFSCVFTGDIEKEAEELILNKNINLKADILKVAHHGSKTSTTLDFLKAVSPKIALIGVGKNNNYGHPNEQIIKRLQENGVRVYRTDNDGEISIVVNKKGIITKINK